MGDESHRFGGELCASGPANDLLTNMQEEEKEFIQKFLEVTALLKRGETIFREELRKAIGFFNVDWRRANNALKEAQQLYSEALTKLCRITPPAEIKDYYNLVKDLLKDQSKWISKGLEIVSWEVKTVSPGTAKSALLECIKGYIRSTETFRSLFSKELRKGEEWLSKQLEELR